MLHDMSQFVTKQSITSGRARFRRIAWKIDVGSNCECLGLYFPCCTILCGTSVDADMTQRMSKCLLERHTMFKG
jgi:hypothetical protein